MPAVALVGAGLSIASGVAAGATTLIGGLQIASGVMAAVGVVSGNKKLTALGSLMGIGAGVANAMSGAGSAASGAGEFSAASADPMANLELATDASAAGAGIDATGGLETATGYSYKPSGATEMSFGGDPAGGMENLGGSGPLDIRSGEVNLGNAPDGAVKNLMEKAKESSNTSTDVAADPVAKQEAPTDEYAKYEAKRNDQKSFDARSNFGVTNKAKGMMAEVMDFIQNPKNAGVLKVGGGLVAGAMKGISDQSLMKQKAALDEEIKARERERLNKSITGMARFA